MKYRKRRALSLYLYICNLQWKEWATCSTNLQR
jgi:hypothetical protein